MTVKIKVYSDYVCPFCFLGKDQLEKAVVGRDVEIEWMPFELRERPLEQLDPANDPHKMALWTQAITPRAEAWGVDMKLPEVSPHPYTELAHEGYHFAKENGKAKEYNDRLYRAFFQEDQNIGEIDVLVKLAEEVGLDGAALKEALDTRKYQEVQKKALKHAHEEACITGVPTFIIGDERITGVASKEVFEQVIDEQSKKTDGLMCDVEGGFCQ